jgi:hypothetical protein
MVIGEHTRDNDLEVNPIKARHVSNVRSVNKDEFFRLKPPKIMGLEESISYVRGKEFFNLFYLTILKLMNYWKLHQRVSVYERTLTERRRCNFLVLNKHFFVKFHFYLLVKRIIYSDYKEILFMTISKRIISSIKVHFIVVRSSCSAISSTLINR